MTFSQDPEEREWVLRAYETHVNSSLSLESCQRLGASMIRSQVLDQFLAKKFPTVKRYGGEGAEAMIGFTDELFDKAAGNDTCLLFIIVVVYYRCWCIRCVDWYAPQRETQLTDWTIGVSTSSCV